MYAACVCGSDNVRPSASKLMPVILDNFMQKLVLWGIEMHTGIYSVYTKTSKTIPIFFGIYHTEKYRYFSVRYIPKNTGMVFEVSVYTEKISVWILRFRYIPKKYRYGF